MKSIHAPDNILIVSLSNIGDVVMTLPVAGVLKAHFPQATISIVVGPKALALFDGTPFFKEVIVYDKHASLVNKLKFVSILRSRRFAMVIDLRNTLIPLLTGAPQRTMPQMPWQKWNGGHMIDKHLARLKQFGLSLEKRVQVPLFTDAHRRTVTRMCGEVGFSGWESKKPYMVIAPAARTPFKMWPTDRFAALIKRMHERYPALAFLLIGSTAEKAIVDAVAADAGISMSAYSLAGRLSLPESACVLAGADMLISNDSAAMHIAYYQGIPVVSIFGPTDPLQYGYSTGRAKVVTNTAVPCVPCMGTTCAINRACLTDLSVDDVMEAVHEVVMYCGKR